MGTGTGLGTSEGEKERLSSFQRALELSSNIPLVVIKKISGSSSTIPIVD